MDMTQVEAAVEAGGGYAAVSVKTLRNAVGASRAKVNVVAEISAGLQAAGYGHIPLAIPKQQDRVVLVYKQCVGAGASTLASVEAAHIGGEKGDGAAWVLATLLPKLSVG
ncbi:hypothetical protein [Streptomyces sp. CA2R106]|uniref:hypothetical protein n=1 Tax=Streptomyces sp. CA2R106 TaxID=3120153 RepID=UPI00300ACD15